MSFFWPTERLGSVAIPADLGYSCYNISRIKTRVVAMSQSGAGLSFFFALCQLRKLLFLLCKVSVCGFVLSCLVQAASAAETDVEFPKTIAWSAYPPGQVVIVRQSPSVIFSSVNTR